MYCFFGFDRGGCQKSTDAHGIIVYCGAPWLAMVTRPAVVGGVPLWIDDAVQSLESCNGEAVLHAEHLAACCHRKLQESLPRRHPSSGISFVSRALSSIINSERPCPLRGICGLCLEYLASHPWALCSKKALRRVYSICICRWCMPREQADQGIFLEWQVRRLESQGLTAKQAEAITAVITEVLNDSLENVAQAFTSKTEMQRVCCKPWSAVINSVTDLQTGLEWINSNSPVFKDFLSVFFLRRALKPKLGQMLMVVLVLHLRQSEMMAEAALSKFKGEVQSAQVFSLASIWMAPCNSSDPRVTFVSLCCSA